MGLSNAISGGIVMFGMTYLVFTFVGLFDDSAIYSDISSTRAELENKMLKTSIDVTINNPPGTDNTFSFEITNTNSEKLWDFENFDVIITYDSSGTTYTETMTYNTACPPVSGEWCIKTWTNDVLDPEILNDGESVTVDTEVNYNLQSNHDLVIIVSTSNGVVASATTVV